MVRHQVDFFSAWCFSVNQRPGPLAAEHSLPGYLAVPFYRNDANEHSQEH